MNDANAPLNMDFPNLQSANSGQRPTSSLQQSAIGSTPETANVEALIGLVQDLNQQNHDLLNRITLLEGELAHHQTSPGADGGVTPWSGESSEVTDEHSSFSPEQVSNLLNQLEFAQQANQRQDIRVESLSTQLTACQSRVEQLEAENDDLQHRCGNQRYRVQHLEDECRDLRLRLQRQQQYTLQFKAALEKCLEVPPPSYGFFHPHEGDYGFAAEADSVYEAAPADLNDVQGRDGVVDSSEENNWLVQPLFPKVQKIQSWATSYPSTGHQNSEWPDAAAEQAELGYASEGPKMPGEAWAPQDKATAGVSGSHLENFPKSRFQNTLLTLAHASQQEDSIVVDSPEPRATQSLDSAFSTEVPTSPESVDSPSDVEPQLVSNSQTNNSENNNSQTNNSQISADSHSFSLAEQISQDVEPQNIGNEAHIQIDSDLASSTGIVDNDAVGVSHDGEPSQAIAPFSSQGIESHGALQSDAKLLKSLASLIDMSAADGLNLPSNSTSDGLNAALGQEVFTDEAPVPSSSDVLLPEPWQPAHSPVGGIAMEQREEEAPSVSDAVNPTTLKASDEASSEKTATFSEVKDPSVERQSDSPAQETLRRAIDLPSFLTNSIRPNPA